ncbi:MAG: nucleoid-associated protein YgaU [Planctomycetota bacterium]|jgi:nucleoid-associated protein YgaU
MGKLEKVGAAVVGVLLCIIVAVGVLNHGKTPKEDGMSEADLEAKRQETALRNDVIKSGGGKVAPTNKEDNVVDLDDLDRRRAAAKEKRAAAKRKAAAEEAEKAKKEGGQPEPALANSGSSKTDPNKNAEAPKGEWPKMYTVQKKDILGTICQKFYKTGRMLKQVRAANPGLDERRLIPGKTVIKLPAPDESIVSGKSTRTTPTAKLALKPRRPGFISTAYIQRHSEKAIADKTPEKGYYIVRKNDSLSKIAEKQLGSIKHAEAIFKANRGLMKNRNRLVVGWKLKMPKVN